MAEAIASASRSVSRAARCRLLRRRSNPPTSSSGRCTRTARGSSSSTPRTAVPRGRPVVSYSDRFARGEPRRLRLRLSGVTTAGSMGKHSAGERSSAEKSTRDSNEHVRRLVGPSPAGRSRRARRALPDPLRPHLRLPAHERRQPARRRGPDDADVPEDARVDRPLQAGARRRSRPGSSASRTTSRWTTSARASAGSRRRRCRSRRARRSRRPSSRRCSRSAGSRC